MPKYPANAAERAFFDVMTSKDLLHAIYYWNANSIRAFFIGDKIRGKLENIKRDHFIVGRCNSTIELLWAIKKNNFLYFKFILDEFEKFNFTRVCDALFMFSAPVHFIAHIRKVRTTNFVNEFLEFIFIDSPNIEVLEWLLINDLLPDFKKYLVISVKMGYLDVIEWAESNTLLTDHELLIEIARRAKRPEIGALIEKYKSESEEIRRGGGG